MALSTYKVVRVAFRNVLRFTFEPQAACPDWFWTVSGREEIIPHSLFMICTHFPPNFNMDLHVTLLPTT